MRATVDHDPKTYDPKKNIRKGDRQEKPTVTVVSTPSTPQS